MKTYWVYIMCSQRNGTLYTGVTNNLGRRIYEHKTGDTTGFTKKYGVSRLIYMELFHSIEEAIIREKCIKKWNRSWKINLIESNNPQWKDLSSELL